MMSVTMLLYALYLSFAAVTLALLLGTVSYSRIASEKKKIVRTGAVLRLVDMVLGASVPLRYMAFPPDVPDRRKLLDKDKSGVFRARKEGWLRREGGSGIKLLLQIAIILVFDWS